MGGLYFPAYATTITPGLFRIIPPTHACSNIGLEVPSRLSFTTDHGGGKQISGDKFGTTHKITTRLDKLCIKIASMVLCLTDFGWMGAVEWTCSFLIFHMYQLTMIPSQRLDYDVEY